MRIVAILLALAIIGVLVSRQLNQGVTTAAVSTADSETIVTPRVPQTPQGTQSFERDMNAFIEASKSRLDEEIEEKAR